MKIDDSKYQEAIDFLFAQLPMFSRVGAAAYKPGLHTSLALDDFFGNPHSKFKSIHVGGTNGKGSTSHSIAAALQASGYKTALYTSPHLADFRERMRINGQMIPKEKVVDFVERWKRSGFSGHPSFFELTMMMAFDWFAAEKVDYAVIEVGMGGRLDSTNIITPILSIITNISPDHMQFLGDTLPKIASEKAGIIKPGIRVVIGEAEGEVEEVFEAKAREVGAPLIKAYTNPHLSDFRHSKEGSWLCTSETFGPIEFELGGDCQRYNLATVLTALGELRKLGVSLSDRSVSEALAHVAELTGLQGRWQRLRMNSASGFVDTICDTGHNEGGLQYSMAQLRREMQSRPGATLRIVAGFVADKAVDHILPMFPSEAVYYLTQAQIPRAMAVDILAQKAAAHGLRFKPYGNVEEATSAALTDAHPDDLLFIGGSTFIVADFLKAFNQ